MDLQLNGKKAIVTGGSEGIGKAIALGLAQEGVDVAICARRKEPLEAAAKEISNATDRNIIPITADLTDTEQANAFIDGAVEALGGIDILVNNAGAAVGGVLEYLSDEQWEDALQLKFFGYVRCTRAVLPHFKEKGGGRGETTLPKYPPPGRKNQLFAKACTPNSNNPAPRPVKKIRPGAQGFHRFVVRCIIKNDDHTVFERMDEVAAAFCRLIEARVGPSRKV